MPEHHKKTSNSQPSSAMAPSKTFSACADVHHLTVEEAAEDDLSGSQLDLGLEGVAVMSFVQTFSGHVRHLLAEVLADGVGIR